MRTIIFFLVSVLIFSSCKKEKKEIVKQIDPPTHIEPIKTPKLFDESHQLVLIAHRGGGGFPENTLQAFESAIEDGTDYIEVDLRTTKDGYLVIMHDSDVDGMTNGKGNVRDLTFEEIKSLRINGSYEVPSFEEVLQIAQNRVNIYVDFKDADADNTFSLLRKYGMEQHFVVYANNNEKVKAWRAIAPEVPLIGSIPLDLKREQVEGFLAENDLDIIDNVYAPAVVEILQQKGKLIWLDIEGPWENPTFWVTALDYKVNGFQTDKPKAFGEFLMRKGMR
ncbi:MAG: glycerophosphodiester phosphodiesterase family protein [Chitinophagales bacterium]|nr:glycerophosphodiester phosphodiesterase family protein [Chitinophagales bacterium]